MAFNQSAGDKQFSENYHSKTTAASVYKPSKSLGKLENIIGILSAKSQQKMQLLTGAEPNSTTTAPTCATISQLPAQLQNIKQSPTVPTRSRTFVTKIITKQPTSQPPVKPVNNQIIATDSQPNPTTNAPSKFSTQILNNKQSSTIPARSRIYKTKIISNLPLPPLPPAKPVNNQIITTESKPIPASTAPNFATISRFPAQQLRNQQSSTISNRRKNLISQMLPKEIIRPFTPEPVNNQIISANSQPIPASTAPTSRTKIGFPGQQLKNKQSLTISNRRQHLISQMLPKEITRPLTSKSAQTSNIISQFLAQMLYDKQSSAIPARSKTFKTKMISKLPISAAAAKPVNNQIIATDSQPIPASTVPSSATISQFPAQQLNNKPSSTISNRRIPLISQMLPKEIPRPSTSKPVSNQIITTASQTVLTTKNPNREDFRTKNHISKLFPKQPTSPPAAETEENQIISIESESSLSNAEAATRNKKFISQLSDQSLQTMLAASELTLTPDDKSLSNELSTQPPTFFTNRRPSPATFIKPCICGSRDHRRSNHSSCPIFLLKADQQEACKCGSLTHRSKSSKECRFYSKKTKDFSSDNEHTI
jgi:hypothetical protein